ncbi:50s ribosomal protein l7/l12 [Quercus suber]|uniref:50s ribosomal protein l7/l12 n=1 Tax=Quercus suber TaxID=58331 RepID=A0AAW0M6M5_QUESU
MKVRVLPEPVAASTATSLKGKEKIIKEVRTFTDLGLKEAKELVEKVPVVLKKGLTKEEADPILAKLKELGATIMDDEVKLEVYVRNWGLTNRVGYII